MAGNVIDELHRGHWKNKAKPAEHGITPDFVKQYVPAWGWLVSKPRDRRM
jgi:hypothetical protein